MPLAPRRAFGVILLAAALALRVAGQDVVVNGPQWLYATPPPARLPHSFFKLRPDFPSAERGTRQIGYVLLALHIDAKGGNMNLLLRGSQIPYERSVEAELRNWKLKPAQDGGKPVDGAVWYGIIFNPASAGKDGPDATPRLVDVTPVFVAKKLLDGLGPRPVLNASLDIDAAGAVTGVQVPAGAEAYRGAIAGSVAAWTFVPARRNGRPIGAKVVLPIVLLVRPGPQFSEGKTTPPRLISRVQPAYPEAMWWSRMRGEVTIEFVVDQTGSVVDPVVAASNNPGFNQAAIDAVLQWRFKPGMRSGRLVKTRMRVPIIFSLRSWDGEEMGNVPFTVGGANQSKLPPQLRYDTAPHVRGVLLPVYPYEQLLAGADGWATVEFLIDKLGRVALTRVVKASRPEFGLALDAAVAGFQYDPAMRRGKPTPTLMVYRQSFSLSMATSDGSTDADSDRYLGRILAKHPDRLVSARVLDQRLRPLSRTIPIFPPDLRGQVKAGSAVIKFVIDTDGRARLPQIVSASAPAFGYAAVQAVSSWRFAPPKARGKPVLTAVEVPFEFR